LRSALLAYDSASVGPTYTFEKAGKPGDGTFLCLSPSGVIRWRSAAQPILEAGILPSVKVDFVEAGIALVVKDAYDVAAGAAADQHGVKLNLDFWWKARGFAARLATLRLNG
jgi:hypothetical protein